MSRWTSLVVLFVGIAVAGCKCNKKDESPATQPMKMSVDACSHCPGLQTATADGKCPLCK